MEYIGEMITVEEAERRLAVKGTSHLIYVFELSYEIGMNGKYVLDGEKYGDISRFINHSVGGRQKTNFLKGRFGMRKLIRILVFAEYGSVRVLDRQFGQRDAKNCVLLAERYCKW